MSIFSFFGKDAKEEDEDSEWASSSAESDFIPEESSESASSQDDRSSSLHSTRGKKRQKKVVRKKSTEKEPDDADDDLFLKRIRFDLKCHEFCRYQKTGVRWLCELHEQCVGGILADEMGLGKTIQVITFLKALAFSRLYNRGFRFTGLGPVLIICPTTLLHQWLREFHRWFAVCRVAVLHSSGTFRGQNVHLIRKMTAPRSDGSVLLTSYGTFQRNYKQLVDKSWHYVILDEGHKIRNPEAQITIAIKQVCTPHRLILSGSPLQNSLKELWLA
ncbi:unnamed protein product [Gongylonema pulchrum]|uniref:Helicase ATP-binding domain-containing protein n=1 Tax=Gongylonema pulchrum TaxID=637853 RepID=A0A183D551_9BILA|nr:unnamed protein product [Gongylonema pulchrum]